jgi:RNA polymerase sigma-70 factor (ECF subfamily)
VRNLSIDRARRRERRGALLHREAAFALAGNEMRSPETLAEESAERVRVRAALDALPEAQRETLLVAFYEGLSYPEIAERDGVPLGTIKSRAARAMAALKSALEEKK